MSPKNKPKPLKIGCTDTDCERNLHCFKKSRQMAETDRGACRECGKKLIDWPRVHERDISDVKHTFDSLRLELVRHSVWHAEIDERAERHARRKGRIRLFEAARTRIENSVGPAVPFRDGTQTPREGNVIFYGQHATACCCRKCMEYWHGVPMGRPLSSDEISYFARLVELFISERMPTLTETGEKIPPLRRVPSISLGR